MAPVFRPRPLAKKDVPDNFNPKKHKATVLSETLKPSTLAPNIRSISWSPTGAMVATAVTVNIRVWNPERPDVKNSTELRDTAIKPGGHGGTVEKAIFSPTHENLLASTGKDGMVKLWDVRTPGSVGALATGPSPTVPGKGAMTIKAGEHKVGDEGLFLTWHPDGAELVVGRKDDVITAVDVRRPDTAMYGASASSNSYEVNAIDRTPVKEGKASYNQMTFSNNGRTLFATTTEGTIRLFDYPSMDRIYTLTGHTSSANVAAFSPAGTYLATGGSDSMISLFNTRTWLCDHVLMDQPVAVRDLSFSFDGSLLVAGSGQDGSKEGDKELCVYHVELGEAVHRIPTSNVPTYAAWHPTRYAIAYAGDPGGLKVVGDLTYNRAGIS